MPEETEIRKQSALCIVNDLAHLLNNINGDVLFELGYEFDPEFENEANPSYVPNLSDRNIPKNKVPNKVLLHSVVLMARSKWFQDYASRHPLVRDSLFKEEEPQQIVGSFLIDMIKGDRRRELEENDVFIVQRNEDFRDSKWNFILKKVSYEAFKELGNLQILFQFSIFIALF
jgi:hypothetical protein